MYTSAKASIQSTVIASEVALADKDAAGAANIDVDHIGT
jgi:hypothetical protein